MKNRKTEIWPKVRSVINEIHLWLGIASGLIIFVVCLSGTIYTFSDEIQRFLEPSRYKVNGPIGDSKLPIAQLILQLEKENDGKVTTINIPAKPDETYQFTLLKKDEKGRGTGFSLDPYSGQVTASGEAVGSVFFMKMFRLHRWLLLDTSIGRPIVGWATVIFTLLILTGMCIWIPQKVRSWKQGLKIKFDSNWKRINHDLHNTLGFYAAFLMLVMSLTGLYWSFDWYKSGLYTIFQVEQPKGRGGRPPMAEAKKGEKVEKETSSIDIALLPWEQYLGKANEKLPYPGNFRISIPEASDKSINLFKTRTGFFAPAAGDKIILDKASAEILEVDIFREKPLNERIMGSIKALHVGNVFGAFSKILYFISCLIATSLPVSGTIIWINKLRKKSKRKKTTMA